MGILIHAEQDKNQFMISMISETCFWRFVYTKADMFIYLVDCIKTNLNKEMYYNLGMLLRQEKKENSNIISNEWILKNATKIYLYDKYNHICLCNKILVLI